MTYDLFSAYLLPSLNDVRKVSGYFDPAAYSILTKIHAILPQEPFVTFLGSQRLPLLNLKFYQILKQSLMPPQRMEEAVVGS